MKQYKPTQTAEGCWRLPLGGVVLFACALTFAHEPSDSFDWPAWRGPRRDGISAEKISPWPNGGLKQLWKAQVGNGFSAVSVAGGRAYTMGNVKEQDIVWCFDAATGKELWTHRYDCTSGAYPGTRCTPTVDGNSVYTLGREGQLYCLDAATGKVRWYKNTKEELNVEPPTWGLACSPLVLGDKLIVDADLTFALDKNTGKLLWKTKGYNAAYSSPVAFEHKGKPMLAAFNATGLIVVDSSDGKVLFEHPWETPMNVNAVTPIVSDGRIFISSNYGQGAALLEIDGNALNVVWQTKEMKNHYNNCVLLDGLLYGFDADRNAKASLKCLSWKTGEVLWKDESLGKGSLMVAGGKLLLLSDSGDLVLADASADGFKVLAVADVLSGMCWTYPVLANGRVYCRNDQGDLVCVDVSGQKAAQTQPKS